MENKIAPVEADAKKFEKPIQHKINEFPEILNLKFDIATGKSRKEMFWKNTQFTWKDLVERLSNTHITAETQQEYLHFKKDQQDEIKDVGCFVGGYLPQGKRKKGNVLHRQLVTLDIDFAQTDFWIDFQNLFSCAACLHSTHKHTTEKPRLRLIIPLSRPVFADEYEAIARKIAGTLDIELFDTTTFQTERLMHWPSTSKDGEYLFEYQDGNFINADAILESYTNWKDSSEWPVSAKVGNVIKNHMTKQGDPLEKPGVIGAFCKTYSITEAIDSLLTDVYASSDIEGRYSYKEGSTAGGLVTYDDKWAYSHHGTDPATGKLCNSFDLVRIHKFGLRDDAIKEGTPVNRFPSFTAMIDFASQDKKVKVTLGKEHLQNAKIDFAESENIANKEAENMSWLGDLNSDKKGNYLCTINNIVLILENDSDLKGTVAFDEFEHRAICKRNLPWRTAKHQDRFLTDSDDSQAKHLIEARYGIYSGNKYDIALSVIYERNKFHPVKDYLQALSWDGIERVESLIIDYLGCTDNAYIRAVTRKTLAAACARVFEPGIKFDYMLTFVGVQGLGKSTLISKLGRQWFSDSITTVTGKESIEQLQGVWLCEMAELAGLKKADVEIVKRYISSTTDRYRSAYGKRVESYPRQCIFFGSTNKTDFLKDATGNRRFWPVTTDDALKTKNVFKDLIDSEIDQIWAEAYSIYKKGEPMFLEKEIEDFAATMQTEHCERDEREGLILKYLDTLLPENWNEMNTYERRVFLQDEQQNASGAIRREKVCAAEIWSECLAGMQKEMTSHNTKFIHDIMRKAYGWDEFKSRTTIKGYGNQKAYYRNYKGIEKFNKTTALP